MEQKLTSLEDMYNYAAGVVSGLVPQETATVVALSGDLGSGKTAFAQGVARALGVREHITSPTFILEKVYELSGQAYDRLIHIDAYRLESGRELIRLGFEAQLADPKNLIVIEWPERVLEVMPQEAIRIELAFVDETTRAVSREH